MKKVLFTAFATMVMFAMVACNNNKAAEATEDTTNCEAVEACEHHCMHEGDSAMCCKAEGAACEHQCAKAEGEKCCKAEAKECEHKCEKACDKKCDKPCEKKCEKAQ